MFANLPAFLLALRECLCLPACPRPGTSINRHSVSSLDLSFRPSVPPCRIPHSTTNINKGVQVQVQLGGMNANLEHKKKKKKKKKNRRVHYLSPQVCLSSPPPAPPPSQLTNLVPPRYLLKRKTKFSLAPQKTPSSPMRFFPVCLLVIDNASLFDLSFSLH